MSFVLIQKNMRDEAALRSCSVRFERWVVARASRRTGNHCNPSPSGKPCPCGFHTAVRVFARVFNHMKQVMPKGRPPPPRKIHPPSSYPHPSTQLPCAKEALAKIQPRQSITASTIITKKQLLGGVRAVRGKSS